MRKRCSCSSILVYCVCEKERVRNALARDFIYINIHTQLPLVNVNVGDICYCNIRRKTRLCLHIFDVVPLTRAASNGPRPDQRHIFGRGRGCLVNRSPPIENFYLVGYETALKNQSHRTPVDVKRRETDIVAPPPKIFSRPQ